MTFKGGDIVRYNAPKTIWHDVVGEVIGDGFEDSLLYTRVRMTELAPIHLGYGMKIGSGYTLLTENLEPVYMKYDPSQQEDTENDI